MTERDTKIFEELTQLQKLMSDPNRKPTDWQKLMNGGGKKA